MSPPPRRLTFAVSTSLLTASLSLGVAGCDEQTVNPKPTPDQVEPDHTVNVAQELPEPKESGANEPEPEISANPGPEPEPKLEAAPEPVHVNEGPEPELVDEPRVNTQPEK